MLGRVDRVFGVTDRGRVSLIVHPRTRWRVKRGLKIMIRSSLLGGKREPRSGQTPPHGEPLKRSKPGVTQSRLHFGKVAGCEARRLSVVHRQRQDVRNIKNSGGKKENIAARESPLALSEAISGLGRSVSFQREGDCKSGWVRVSPLAQWSPLVLFYPWLLINRPRKSFCLRANRAASVSLKCSVDPAYRIRPVPCGWTWRRFPILCCCKRCWDSRPRTEQRAPRTNRP